MASTLAAYKAEDIHLFRLKKITAYVSTKVLHRIFQEGTKSRKRSKPLFDYYSNKGVAVHKFKGCLNKNQIDTIQRDPTGSIFDVTLLFRCIQWGNDKLANKNDDLWKEGNGSLESHLTAVKNRRNEISHDEIAPDNRQFLDKTEELRKLLTKTLELAGIRYGIPQADVDKETDEVNTSINCLRDKPWLPMNFADYKKQNYFIEQGDYVRNDGTPILRSQYEDRDIVTPGALLLNMNFKVKDIYTDMVLIDQSNQGTELAQSFEDLLKDTIMKLNGPVILVEGLAGVGKTTLTKKILCDWASGQSKMKNLTSYDLLLYAECRNNSISDFKALVVSLMPKIARSFKDNDFMYVVLDQKVIVLVDGLDELNKASTELFKEILELKRTYGITVVVTTRPEKVVTYYCMVNPLNIKTKHVRLVGIPQNKINTFAIQYHTEMKKNGVGPLEIDSLLDYLKQTALRLGDLWLLPYNLILLIILWALDPSAIYSITTASELYWKIIELILIKLKRRLLQNDETSHISESLLSNKIEQFMTELCSQALLGLVNDDINLPERSYKHLEQTCIKANIPADEMIGAFLKKVVIRTPQGFDTQHSFPHKGFQEFLGAKKIFQDILTMPENPDIKETLREIEGALKRYMLPQNVCRGLLKITEKKINEYAPSVVAPSVIRNILENMHSPQDMDIRKHQNLLIILIGMFYLESNCKPISESIKSEALKLLGEAGIRDREDWLRVLNTVRCDHFVATFICKQPKILEGTIKVKDANIFAYVSLMGALTTPLDNADTVKVEIDIKGDTTEVSNLIKQIKEKDLKVTKLLLRQIFRNSTSSVKLEDDIVSVLERYPLEAYTGAFNTHMKIPETVKALFVSLYDVTCLAHLNCFFQSQPNLTELGVLMSHTFDQSLLIPLPDTSAYFGPSLYIVDVEKAQDIKTAVEIVKKLHPLNKNKGYGILEFPGCKLDPSGIEAFLTELQGVTCTRFSFPQDCKPSSTKTSLELENLANTSITWGNRF